LKDRFVLIVLVAVCTLSYFVYSAYWLAKTIPWVVSISLNPVSFSPPTGLLFSNSISVFSAYVMEYSGFLGLVIRVAGASYALAAVFLISKDGVSSFPKHRNKVCLALLLNGIYFFSFIPAVFFLLNFSALPLISNRLLSLSMLTQIALISSFLIFLGLRTRRSGFEVGSVSFWKWIGLAVMAYTVAIWVTYMSKWAEMMAVDPYLFTALSIRIVGFLNTVIIQSLAALFAIVGVVSIYKKSTKFKTFLLWGLSLVFLSLHTTIYTIYCASVGIPSFIIFGELWQIPLMAFGIYLMFLAFNFKRHT
jgi:hypothetical protein